MIATFRNLVLEALPHWLFGGHATQAVPARRVAPSPHSEAAAAAWLMERERRRR